MANDLNGFLAVYAQESLAQLIASAPILTSFSTDFSTDAATGGATVTTRIPSTTYTLNDTDANGPTALAASSSAVTMTMKQRDITHQFSELEWSSSPNLLETFVPSMVQSLVDGVSADILTVVTNANYSTAGHVGGAATFSGSVATKLAQTLSTANVPSSNRVLVVKPTYFETLVNSINPAYSYGNPEVVQNYRIANYAGFAPVMEYSNIPENSENLVGFAAHKSSIAVATRLPQLAGSGEVAILTDESSGLSIAFKKWFSDDDQKVKLMATLIYGFAKGSAGLKRITSA